MASFADYKKNRQSALQALSAELEKVNSKGGGGEEDARFWTVTRDKAGNGTAIIRFVGPPPGEDIPFVRYFRHSFQGPTGLWYIENCPTSIGRKDCPVCDHNRELWNTGVKSNQELVSKQKRRMVIVSNILIVKDPANPANEGQVKLFKYGKKIHDKITDLMNPTFDGDEPINPFDLYAGANFKLIVKTQDKFPNYDKSVFEKVTPVSDNEKEIERIWNAQHSLAEFLDPVNYKTKEELKAQLDRVLGITGSVPRVATPSATPSVGKTIEEDETPPFETDEDIDADFFKKMAEA